MLDRTPPRRPVPQNTLNRVDRGQEAGVEAGAGAGAAVRTPPSSTGSLLARFGAAAPVASRVFQRINFAAQSALVPAPLLSAQPPHGDVPLGPFQRLRVPSLAGLRFDARIAEAARDDHDGYNPGGSPGPKRQRRM